MKFFHLSDLHIGKQFHRYHLKEDQEIILDEVISYAEKLCPDAVVIAGDIYDKSVPSAEAVTIFDDFLTKLTETVPDAAILVISGNHDSAQRLEFASQILGKHHIYIGGTAPRHKEDYIKCVTLKDDFGDVNFYLLPFLKPGMVRGIFNGELPESYEDAVKRMLERETVDYGKRNVLVSHQFYTAGGTSPETCDSETVSVGGIDNVDVQAVRSFDYVALGHIHGAQSVGAPYIRYPGTLLKYSVSESGHHKSLTVVTLKEKGEPPVIECLELHPLRDVQKKRGLLRDIIGQANGIVQQDYVSITLTDEIDPYKPKDQLERVYSHILEIRVDNQRTRRKLEEFDDEVELSDPLTVFSDFFGEVHGKGISEEERFVMEQIMENAKEEL